MKRIQCVKKQEEMSHSYENNTTVLAASLAELARELIQQNIISYSEAKKYCGETIQNDHLFQQLFPTIFNIELMKYRINNKSYN